MGFDPTASDEIDAIADRIWARIVGANFDPLEFNLRAKLALETRLLGPDRPPFGLDRLNTVETANYVGVKPETLQDRQKRRALGISEPYNIGRKLYWRRSELDAWIETQRETRPALDAEAATAPLPKRTGHPRKQRGGQHVRAAPAPQAIPQNDEGRPTRTVKKSHRSHDTMEIG
jgi:hypothetical protein